MSQNDLPVVQVPDPNNVIYPRYRRRHRFFCFVASLYLLMRDDPNYNISDWFPLVYAWSVNEARSRNYAILDDAIFANCFYHGVAYCNPLLYLQLRSLFLGDE